jgi:hypothetical protein
MKTILMLAAAVTSSVLLVPTLAHAETVEFSISLSSADIERGKIAKEIAEFCAEPEMRGADRFNMERLCIASFHPKGGAAELALKADDAKAPRG